MPQGVIQAAVIQAVVIQGQNLKILRQTVVVNQRFEYKMPLEPHHRRHHRHQQPTTRTQPFRAAKLQVITKRATPATPSNKVEKPDKSKAPRALSTPAKDETSNKRLLTSPIDSAELKPTKKNKLPESVDCGSFSPTG